MRQILNLLNIGETRPGPKGRPGASHDRQRGVRAHPTTGKGASGRIPRPAKGHPGASHDRQRGVRAHPTTGKGASGRIPRPGRLPGVPPQFRRTVPLAFLKRFVRVLGFG